MLAHGHVLTQARQARRRSRVVRDESSAVRAQAEQAIRRSNELRREPGQ